MNDYNQNEHENEVQTPEVNTYSQQQSGYTGYTGYTGYRTRPPQKPRNDKKPPKKPNGLLIALIGVSAVCLVLLMGIIVLFANLDISKTFKESDKETTETEQSATKEKSEKQEKKNDVKIPSLEKKTPTNGELAVPDIYTKVKDSVVGILITKNSNGQVAEGSGTGIILSEDGYISTNAHVVEDALSIKVVLSDETEYTAELIGSDSKTDLAVVKVDATGLQPAEFGDSDDLQVGETVVAIGNPYGLELAGTVTCGIVSALNRRIAIQSTYMTLIQTDASINPGNSGGPLVNSYGQVVGVTSSKIVTTGYEGIGFAIPITGAKDIISELIQYGVIKNRPFIGIQGGDLDTSYTQLYNIPKGVYVQYVDPESDAHKQGLKKGDIITAVDGVDIECMADLDEEKNKHVPGDKITLSVYRNTKTLKITIELSESSGD